MAACQITLTVESKLLQLQLQQLSGLFQNIPKRRARRFYRKVLCLICCSRNICSQVVPSKGGLAAGACIGAVHIRVGGLDELIAAAMRASKRNSSHGGALAG